MISISAVPGGNPAAKADPEGYASEWTLCSCKAYTCDRCLIKQQGKCGCGQPARLFNEAERIRIASGGPRPTDGPASAGPAAAPPPVSARVAPPAGAGGPPVLMRQAFEGIAQQLQADLHHQNRDRAKAMASLMATMMATQGVNGALQEVPFLMQFGENFYNWGFGAEGAQFWKGIFQLLKAHGKGESDEALKAIAAAGAFQVLAGEITVQSPHAGSTASFVLKVFGPQHPLTGEVMRRVGAAIQNTPPAAAAPPVSMAVGAPPAAPSASGFDPSTKLALWVTLAFLDIANADGKVSEPEYLSWKTSMQRMKLPDVWERFGLQTLIDMLQKGLLQQLSAEFMALPEASRANLMGSMIEFMMADGVAEPREMEAVKRISGWLGLSVKFG